MANRMSGNENDIEKINAWVRKMEMHLAQNDYLSTAPGDREMEVLEQLRNKTYKPDKEQTHHQNR